MIGKILNWYVDTLFGVVCRGVNILWCANGKRSLSALLHGD